MRWKAKDCFIFHKWFAWHPIVIYGQWVWLEIVQRRYNTGKWQYICED